MDRFITAVERIADSLARLAGLSRPRLEAWHEQDEYSHETRTLLATVAHLDPKANRGSAGQEVQSGCYTNYLRRNCSLCHNTHVSEL